MSDLLDIRDAATDALDGITVSLAVVTSALSTGTITAGQLGNLRASLTGHRADIAAIRVDLDALDVTDHQLYDDAAVTLTLWKWERLTRHQLATLLPAVRTAETIATRLVAGSARQVVTARDGDTLQSLAARYLGSWQEWPRLAEVNGLTPGPLTPGAQIAIPAKR